MSWLVDFFDKRNEAAEQLRNQRICELLDMLGQIPTGKLLLETVKDRRLSVSFNSDVEGHAATVNSRFIRLNPKIPAALQPVYLAHEIRHVWQDNEGLILRRKVNVVDSLVNSRFAEADAFAIEAQIAWELTKHNVLPDAWSVYSRKNPDIASACKDSVKRDANTGMNGNMMRAVFNRWFNSPYKDSYDNGSIENSRAQLLRRASGRAATQEFEKQRLDGAPERMSSKFLQEFGRVAGGHNYLSDIDTTNAFYTGYISKKNQKAIDRLNV